MTINTNIQGIFRLKTPLHCASPDEHGVNEHGRVVPGKTGRPCTATVHQRILANGQRDNIPYFPANDLRGRLRRKAASIVMDALARMGAKVPVELYAGLCSGAANAKPENELTIEEAIRGSQHVYMGLFGGGTRLLRSGYSVQDAVPIVRSTVAAGLVPEGFGDYAEKPLPASTTGTSETWQGDGWKLTDVRHILRVDDVARVLKPAAMEQYIENCMTVVPEYQGGVLANRAARKEGKETGETTKKTDVGNMVTMQAIIPGTELYVRLDMQDTLSDAQIGLLLASLEALVQEQALGGWVRTGYGRFDVTHFKLTRDGEETGIFEQADNGQYRLTDATTPYIDAMRAEVSALTVEDLMSFFTPRKAKAA